LHPTASQNAASNIDLGLAPSVAAVSQVGISLAMVVFALFSCFVLSVYMRPYKTSFVNKLDLYIDASIIMFTISMVLPSDLLYYKEPQQQALLFTISGIVGLCTWSSSPSASVHPDACCQRHVKLVCAGISPQQCSCCASAWTCVAKESTCPTGYRQAHK
jgi:hypothetical protein